MSESESVEPVEILLVEDNLGDIRITQEAFRIGKVTNNLRVVMDGEQAMKYLRQDTPYDDAPMPDLILLDLNLPKKDGQQVLSEIRADDTLKHIPVVVLTSSHEEEDINRAYDLNCNCYVVKPVDLERFMEIIEELDNFWMTFVKFPTKDIEQHT